MKHTIKIVYDTCNESPRELDNLGTIFSAHRTVTGEEQATGEYNSLEEEFFSTHNKNEIIYLPVYLYEHSGITINTTGFSCPWDSGQLGYIFVDKKKVREEFGWKRISPQREKQIQKYLKGEIETFDQYLRGEVYGFIVEDEEGNHVDSCYGFYDWDTMKEYIDQSLFENFEEVFENAKENIV